MKLFVGNLPYKATEGDLQAFFAEAGVQVDSVNILRDRFSGEARGFGFVEINDDGAANQAVQACNGRNLMGRALVVNEARPPEKRDRVVVVAQAVAVAASAILGVAGTAGNSASSLSGVRACFPAKHAHSQPSARLRIDTRAARRCLQYRSGVAAGLLRIPRRSWTRILWC